ncbi:MAG: helix-turn-helix transcriptional regulator [Niabella sp.]|nr:helix-turn-helix transcriptional regulator [Niabella sp.]
MTKAKTIKQGGDLSYHKIGEAIRNYRKEKKLKLIDLAARANIGAALLSKIENGRMIPTIPTLFSIVAQLQVPINDFFSELTAEDDFPGYIFIPRATYKPYVKEEKATGFNYFSVLERGMSSGSFQISVLELVPGAKRKQVTTDAFEFIYTLNGSLSYHLEKKVLKLNTGDSLYFDGNIPHVPVNDSGKKVTLLVVYFFTS